MKYPDRKCYYCDKVLDEDKGEVAHGCLDCYQNVYVDKIDSRDKEIKALRKLKNLHESNPLIAQEEISEMSNLIESFIEIESGDQESDCYYVEKFKLFLKCKQWKKDQ